MNVYRPSSPPNYDGRISKHILHLYTSNMDKYTIQKMYLATMKDDDRAIIVSSEDPQSINQEFDYLDVEMKIVKPEEMGSLESTIKESSRTHLIIDAASFSNRNETEIAKREMYLDNIVKKHSISCLCTYSVKELSPTLVKPLTKFHNQLQLTTSDLTLISGDFIDRSMTSYDSIKKMVKDNLEAITLAHLCRKAMSGSDMIGDIHFEFNVLLSPGTVYPLLHSLQKKGLLNSVKEGKEIRYFPAEGSDLEIKRLVNEHIQTRKVLNSYLEKELDARESQLLRECRK